MKLNKERGGISLKDIITLALCGGGVYYVYSHGYLDGYLPQQYTSGVVLKDSILPGGGGKPVDPVKVVAKAGISRLDPSSYPQKVKLLKATEFPAVFNGRPAGKVRLEAGGMVKLVEVKEKEVVVEHVGAQKTIPIEETDTVERIHEIVKMNGSASEAPHGYQKIRWNNMNRQIP